VSKVSKPHGALKTEACDVFLRNQYTFVRTVESVFDLFMNFLSCILQMGIT
jgi:hypothetical protein